MFKVTVRENGLQQFVDHPQNIEEIVTCLESLHAYYDGPLYGLDVKLKKRVLGLSQVALCGYAHQESAGDVTVRIEPCKPEPETPSPLYQVRLIHKGRPHMVVECDNYASTTQRLKMWSKDRAGYEKLAEEAWNSMPAHMDFFNKSGFLTFQDGNWTIEVELLKRETDASAKVPPLIVTTVEDERIERFVKSLKPAKVIAYRIGFSGTDLPEISKHLPESVVHLLPTAPLSTVAQTDVAHRELAEAIVAAKRTTYGVRGQAALDLLHVSLSDCRHHVNQYVPAGVEEAFTDPITGLGAQISVSEETPRARLARLIALLAEHPTLAAIESVAVRDTLTEIHAQMS